MVATGKVTIHVADLPQFQRLLAAVRKIADHSGTHPNHLGGCIGVLSEPSCDCGLADLRCAVRALVGDRSHHDRCEYTACSCADWVKS